jgi:hypothetical protein
MRTQPPCNRNGPYQENKMTTQANLPALLCFGSAIVCFWVWCRLTIGEYEKRKEDEDEK